MRNITFTAIAILLGIFISPIGSNASSDDIMTPQEVHWTFQGFTGKFDRQAIQRGFKVFKEVCSACHSAKALSFRNLMEVGFAEQEAKSIASEYKVQDGPDNEGQMYDRPATLADYLPGPYANDQEARAANNGALPPDLSLIIKARHDGANYVYSLLTGYQKAPENFSLGDNMYYNPYFAGGGQQLSMPPPLVSSGQVQFDDGTTATVEQMASDVVEFLQWLAEPEMEDRKRLGIRVLLFLFIFTIVAYLVNHRLWKSVK